MQCCTCWLFVLSSSGPGLDGEFFDHAPMGWDSSIRTMTQLISKAGFAAPKETLKPVGLRLTAQSEHLVHSFAISCKQANQSLTSPCWSLHLPGVGWATRDKASKFATAFDCCSAGSAARAVSERCSSKPQWIGPELVAGAVDMGMQTA